MSFLNTSKAIPVCGINNIFKENHYQKKKKKSMGNFALFQKAVKLSVALTIAKI